jgi:lysophospholipase L1-like esterase
VFRLRIAMLLTVMLTAVPCFLRQAATTAAQSVPLKTESATMPVARAGSDWANHHATLVDRAKNGDTEIAFFGDSIVFRMNGELLRRTFSDKTSVFGIGGDRTEHLLYRLQNGELEFPKDRPPNEVVLLIGTNNLGLLDMQASPDEDTIKGIELNVSEIAKRLPTSNILVVGILPRGEKADDPFRTHISIINQQLSVDLKDQPKVSFVDIGDKFTRKDGSIEKSVMHDSLHPTAEIGNSIMFKALKRKVNKLNRR